MQQMLSKQILQTAIITGVMAAMVGCSTTAPTRVAEQAKPVAQDMPARIEIQEAVGFTIVE